MSEVGHVRNALEAFTNGNNTVLRHVCNVRELGSISWLSAGGYVIVKEDDYIELVNQANGHVGPIVLGG